MSQTIFNTEARNFIESFYEEVFHRGNLDVLEEIFSEAYLAHGAGCQPGGERRSTWQLEEVVGGTRVAFPDLRFTVEKVIAWADGDTAELCCCYRFEGTHRGSLQGLAPTFQRVNVSGMDFYRIKGGKIVEGWESFDSLELLRQLGAIPGTRSTPASHHSTRKPTPRPPSPAPPASATASEDGWSTLAMLAAFVFGFSIGDD